MGVVIGIGAGTAALVALGVWAFRKNKEMGAEADHALNILAQRLGGSYPSGQPRTIAGTLQGRVCHVAHERLVSPGDQSDVDFFVSMKMDIQTATTLDFCPRISRLDAPRGGGVENGDPEFDKCFVLGTNDVAKTAQALRPEMRTAFVEWSRTGWLYRVWAEGGCGLLRKEDVEKAGVMLDALAELAAGLE